MFPSVIRLFSSDVLGNVMGIIVPDGGIREEKRD